tara:strand:- start:3184 stop:3480 length:297 start_codon:yes stop_codon:yes gene_type:complete
MNIGASPPAVRFRRIYGARHFARVGFTKDFFVTAFALDMAALAISARLGILVRSTLSAAVALFGSRFAQGQTETRMSRRQSNAGRLSRCLPLNAVGAS